MEPETAYVFTIVRLWHLFWAKGSRFMNTHPVALDMVKHLFHCKNTKWPVQSRSSSLCNFSLHLENFSRNISWALFSNTWKFMITYFKTIQNRWQMYMFLFSVLESRDRFCGLVVRVSGYISSGPEFDFRRFHIFWEATGLERGPLSLVRTTEELLEGKVAAPV
jgi:hypothetical protein